MLVMSTTSVAGFIGINFLTFLKLALSNSTEVYTAEDVIDRSIPEFDTVLSDEDLQDAEKFQPVDLKTVLPDDQLHKLDTYDPTLRAGKFEGDIESYTPEERATIANNGISVARSAVRRSWQLWPNKEVPYVLSSRYGKYSRKAIGAAMKKYQSESCVRFVPRNKHKDYVYIYPDDGCYSLVGRVGGRQPVSLDEGCLESGTIVHELMHAVGFFHEQSRNDRDDYIRVNWKNIVQNAQDQFDKYSLNTINHLGLPYDYGSVMHYGPYAFSKYPFRKSGKTIEPLKSGGKNMGQRKGFSKIDLKKLNKLYTCSKEDIKNNKKKPDTSPGQPDTNTKTTNKKGGKTGVTLSRCRNRGWFCSVRIAVWSCKDRDLQHDCQKSCDLCDSTGSGSQGKTDGMSVINFGNHRLIIIQGEGVDRAAPCEDHSDNCAKWKSSGHCKTHLGYMMRKCKKTCSECGVTDVAS